MILYFWIAVVILLVFYFGVGIWIQHQEGQNESK